MKTFSGNLRRPAHAMVIKMGRQTVEKGWNGKLLGVVIQLAIESKSDQNISESYRANENLKLRNK